MVNECPYNELEKRVYRELVREYGLTDDAPDTEWIRKTGFSCDNLVAKRASNPLVQAEFEIEMDC